MIGRLDNWEAERVTGIPSSATIEIASRIKEMRQVHSDVIDLGSGSPEFDTPEDIKIAAQKAMFSGKEYMGYTASAGIQSLREMIVQKMASENEIRTTIDQVIVTVGVKEGIGVALQACFNPGDEVLLLSPAWVTYEPLLRLAQLEPVNVPMASWDLTLITKQFEVCVTAKTRGIILSNPHNPTGRNFRSDELRMLAELADRYNLLVLVDEVLEYLNYEEHPHTSIAAFPGMDRRTITFNGFSKAYCMAGWRIGYVVGPERIIQSMLRIHQHLVTCVNGISQSAGLAALQGDQAGRHRIKEALLKRRNLLVELLNAIPGFRCSSPEAGLFCFPDISGTGYDDKELSHILLEEMHIGVLPGCLFGPGGHGHLRIAFGRKSTDDLTEAVRRIEKFFKNGKAR